MLMHSFDLKYKELIKNYLDCRKDIGRFEIKMAFCYDLCVFSTTLAIFHLVRLFL
jgi:hypothetical protein